MDTSSYIKLFDSNAHAEWQGPRFTENSQGNGLAEMLQDLDDETLRKIFRMQLPLTVDKLQCDEGPPIKNNDRRHDGREAAVSTPLQTKNDDRRHSGGEAAVGRPPQMKNDNRRHNGREAAVGRPPQMKKVDQRHNERRASMTIDDQQCSLGDQQCKEWQLGLN